MERLYPKITINLWLIFLFVFQLAQGQMLCSHPETVVQVNENNAVGEVIATITREEGVDLSLEPVDSPFELNANDIRAKEVLDHEKQSTYNLRVTCIQLSTGAREELNIFVFVKNVNDNPPVFGSGQFNFSINELSPVDTLVAKVAATDADDSTLYYSLDPETVGFKIQTINTPNLLVQTPLDYDTVKNVQLTLRVRDTETPSPEGEPSFTAATTIMITIVDVDNRPPWFKPCTDYSINGATICQGSGYRGNVNLTEQKAGPLQLDPGPLYAIDGDYGINEEITYQFLSGNDARLFEINDVSGNITMLGPANVLGQINLIVMAAQKFNTLQFSTTTVTVTVLTKSLHPPRFEREQYDCFVTGVGAMALDINDNSPIRILATDDDIEGGVNPDIRYNLLGSKNFTLIDGYLFMTIDSPLGVVPLQVEAEDTANKDKTSIGLKVEILSGIPTTSMASSSTDIVSTTPVEMTTEIVLTNMTTLTTLDTVPTTDPTVTTVDTVPTTDPTVTTVDTIVTTQDISTAPSVTTEESPSTKPSETYTDSTTHANTGGVIIPSGGYRPEDMAALGASLAVLLFISAVAIGVLACRIRKGDAAWKKISEASIFRSSLGRSSSSWKEGVQYTNESFHHDDDSGSTGSAPPVETNINLRTMPGTRAGDVAVEGAIVKATSPANGLSNVYSTISGELDQPDNDKEVKPILTKERRVDEGYKSVWFKEDIDPNAKDEVVIIPDNGEEPEVDEEDEEEEESSSRSTPAGDTDLDSGIGVRM